MMYGKIAAVQASKVTLQSRSDNKDGRQRRKMGGGGAESMQINIDKKINIIIKRMEKIMLPSK